MDACSRLPCGRRPLARLPPAFGLGLRTIRVAAVDACRRCRKSVHRPCTRSQGGADEAGPCGGRGREGVELAQSRLSPALAAGLSLGLLLAAEPSMAGPSSLALQHSNILFSVADLGGAAVGLASFVLKPVLAIGQILFVIRIVLTWYPEVEMTKLPWSIACVPTEPILKPTRAVVPPAFGVDISPVIWVGILSFINEILLGPQGIFTLIEKQV
ncbi:unnamed protein product [Ostreobium quekettii]|uniref:YGGT family-domain-containing protein n=1 Tax=Ostreobium quekettii TaxID=121088 RepID=A0A8S1J2D1_9CHLO|nr:unnamed protein product [Ostreobium quekettii]|eukprot:evm.model.scf_540EXC.6 EVM.evm.TU.scf_540EXC.6   scf_540EXC:49338-49979(+)